jgi:hypothetical protein
MPKEAPIENSGPRKADSGQPFALFYIVVVEEEQTDGHYVVCSRLCQDHPSELVARRS